MARRGDVDTTFLIAPAPGKRFSSPAAKEVVKAVLAEHLGKGPAYDTEMGTRIAEDIRNRLKEWALPRYKIMVQVVVGEQKGEGVRMGTRCLWDAATDTLASETFMTDALFAVATVYAVYLY